MRRLPRRTLVALLVLIALAGAVGWNVMGEDPDLSPGGDLRPTGSHSDDDLVARSGSSQSTATVPGVDAGSEGGAGASPSLNVPDDYVYGSYDKYGSDDPRPRGCALKRGVPCNINFHWKYRLTTLDKALVRTGAFENGSSEPVAYQDNPVGKGSGRGFGALHYIPSSEATRVVFKVQLVTTDGELLFHMDPPPTTLPVTE